MGFSVFSITSKYLWRRDSFLHQIVNGHGTICPCENTTRCSTETSSNIHIIVIFDLVKLSICSEIGLSAVTRVDIRYRAISSLNAVYLKY